MSYGTDPWGRQTYGGQGLPPVMAQLAAKARVGLRAGAGLVAQAALQARVGLALGAQAGLGATTQLAGRALVGLRGWASRQGTTALGARLRLALRSDVRPQRYYLVVGIQAINTDNIVVQGKMKEWAP